MANITIQKKTNNAIFMRGAIALRIDDKTTCKLGTPLTSLRGRSTRNARIIFKSKPIPSLDINIVNRPVETTKKSIIFHKLCKYAPLCSIKPAAKILKNDSVQKIARK